MMLFETCHSSAL